MRMATINRRISFTAIKLKITKNYFNFPSARTFDEAGEGSVLADAGVPEKPHFTNPYSSATSVFSILFLSLPTKNQASFRIRLLVKKG